MTAPHLVTVGLAAYANRPEWAIPAAADGRARVAALLGPHAGDEEDWTEHATTTHINRRLGSWERRRDGSEILYWTGHGESGGDGYFLALADSDDLHGSSALSDGQLSRALRQLERSRRAAAGTDWVLLILDTCGSGDGAWRIWRAFDRPPRNVGVVATTGEGAAYSGAFPDVLADVLDGFGGNDTAAIPVDELLRRLAARLGSDKVNGKFEPSAVLPHRPGVPPPVQAPIDVYGEVRAALAAAPPGLRDHFYAKAQGAELGEAAWNFTGRAAELHRIAGWLRTARDGLLVVTGPAGSGKSALLGMVLAAADPRLRAALPDAARPDPAVGPDPGGPDPGGPDPGGLDLGELDADAVLHLSGRTLAETVSALAADLGVGPVTGPDDLAAALRERPGPHRTIVVDALDEARDPFPLAGLLRGLAEVPGCRVLAGTRRSLGEDPDRPDPGGGELIDVLGAGPDRTVTLGRAPEAVRGYVRRRLRGTGVTAPERVAERLAGARQPFLFARLAVHEIIADPAVAASEDTLDRLLAGGHAGVFGHAVRRLADRSPAVEALLHVLAYARGRGFPRTGGVWEAAAASIAGVPIGDGDVTAALELAGPYIMQDTEGGQAVYRLAHRTFVDWYRSRT